MLMEADSPGTCRPPAGDSGVMGEVRSEGQRAETQGSPRFGSSLKAGTTKGNLALWSVGQAGLEPPT